MYILRICIDGRCICTRHAYAVHISIVPIQLISIENTDLLSLKIVNRWRKYVSLDASRLPFERCDNGKAIV